MAPLPRSRSREIALLIAIYVGAIVLPIGLSELYFRHQEAKNFLTPDCRWIADEELGFVNPRNKTCIMRSAEFDYRYRLNSDGHPDDEYREDRRNCTFVAVGDSHTFGVGVTDQEAWPNVAERRLTQMTSVPLQVVNMGVAGYSLGQEYLLAQRYVEKYSARHVLIGFSLATDAYDIRTPQDGGFIYGADFGRKYFDIEGGRLVLRYGAGTGQAAHSRSADNGLLECADSELRNCLQRKSALVRALARGPLGQYMARVLRSGNGSSWASAESVVAKQLSAVDAKSWRLIELILRDMKQKFAARDIAISVVIIPYLPQVYPEVWARAFGDGNARYSRFAGNRRMTDICARIGIECIDVTGKLIEAVRADGEWLHYAMDAHPTSKGHAVIGEVVAAALSDRVSNWCGKRP